MATKPPNLAALRAARLPPIAERVQLQADTFGQSEARAGIAAHVAAAAAEIDQRLRYCVTTGQLTDVLALRARPDGYVDLAPMLAVLIGPDALAAALDRYALDLPASTDPVATADRLAGIAAELVAIEDAEEVEVCRLEGLGERPARRADADPAIVLKLRA